MGIHFRRRANHERASMAPPVEALVAILSIQTGLQSYTNALLNQFNFIRIYVTRMRVYSGTESVSIGVLAGFESRLVVLTRAICT